MPALRYGPQLRTSVHLVSSPTGDEGDGKGLVGEVAG
jgi:hypothetical protein